MLDIMKLEGKYESLISLNTKYNITTYCLCIGLLVKDSRVFKNDTTEYSYTGFGANYLMLSNIDLS